MAEQFAAKGDLQSHINKDWKDAHGIVDNVKAMIPGIIYINPKYSIPTTQDDTWRTVDLSAKIPATTLEVKLLIVGTALDLCHAYFRQHNSTAANGQAQWDIVPSSGTITTSAEITVPMIDQSLEYKIAMSGTSVLVYLVGYWKLTSTVTAGTGGTGVTSFLALTDTPDDYSVAKKKYAQVNAAGTSMEFNFITAPMKDIRDYTPTGSYSYLEAAVTGAGSSNVTFGISTPQTLLAASFTEVVGTAAAGVRAYSIPINAAVYAAKGGIITIPASGEVVGGITITKHILKIKGAFSAGYYQVFNCLGTSSVQFGPGAVEETVPHWFGSTGIYSESVDDSIFAQAAVDSAIPYICKSYNPAGEYNMKSGVNVFSDTGFTFYGAGVANTKFYAGDSDMAQMFLFMDATGTGLPVSNIIVEDFYAQMATYGSAVRGRWAEVQRKGNGITLVCPYQGCRLKNLIVMKMAPPSSSTVKYHAYNIVGNMIANAVGQSVTTENIQGNHSLEDPTCSNTGLASGTQWERGATFHLEMINESVFTAPKMWGAQAYKVRQDVASGIVATITDGPTTSVNTMAATSSAFTSVVPGDYLWVRSSTGDQDNVGLFVIDTKNSDSSIDVSYAAGVRPLANEASKTYSFLVIYQPLEANLTDPLLTPAFKIVDCRSAIFIQPSVAFAKDGFWIHSDGVDGNCCQGVALYSPMFEVVLNPIKTSGAVTSGTGEMTYINHEVSVINTRHDHAVTGIYDLDSLSNSDIDCLVDSGCTVRLGITSHIASPRTTDHDTQQVRVHVPKNGDIYVVNNGLDNVVIANGKVVSRDEETFQLHQDWGTPDVANGKIYICNNTVPTDISKFLGGVSGQEIIIKFTNANTTLKESGYLILQGGADFVSANYSIVRLLCLGSDVWWEMNRSVNG